MHIKVTFSPFYGAARTTADKLSSVADSMVTSFAVPVTSAETTEDDPHVITLRELAAALRRASAERTGWLDLDVTLPRHEAREFARTLDRIDGGMIDSGGDGFIVAAIANLFHDMADAVLLES